jgi:acetyl-CoA carboxylase carboxyltransferase component
MRRQMTHFAESGRFFHDITELSAAGIPTLSLVFGSSTAGGAYQPGMSDYNIFIKGRSKVFLGGPPLVKMATGEDSDDEELGGAEMHATLSGLADYLAEDELDALRLGRAVMAHLNWRKLGPGPTMPADEPIYDPEELLGLLSPDLRTPMDIREVIGRIVDGSRFEEFKPLYGPTLVTAWASIHGFPVGILGNNGVLFSDSSQKAAQFIQLCNQIDVPIIFLQNITGYIVGKVYEQGGIVKDGSKMINAVSNSKVPHITVIVGASYGAGNYGMSGRAYDTRFVFTWPTAKIAVMGPKQLAGVMSIVRRGAAARAGREFDEEEDARLTAAVEDREEKVSLGLYATGRVADDGIIDPRDTRTVLGIALSTCHNAEVKGAEGYGVFRM